MSSLSAPVVVALGSNLSGPAQQVARAFAALRDISGTSDWRCSSVYRTPPWGLGGQPDFANAVALGSCVLSPLALLAALQGIERSMGRVRTAERNGPRLIDLDLIVFGTRQIEINDLTLPHARATARNFVLAPWLALDPAAQWPDGSFLQQFWDALPEVDRRSITPWRDDGWQCQDGAC